MAGEPDDIRSLLEGAIDGTVTADAPLPVPELDEAAPLTGETAEQKADRARDEAGRFAKEPKEKAPRETLTIKPKEKPAVAPAPQTAATPAAATTPVTAAATDATKIAAPKEWMGAARVKWDRLPSEVQKEISDRWTKFETDSAEMAPLKELFDVNREFLVNQAGSVPNAMTQMMQFARMSVDNPVQLAEHILRARGLDPRAVFSGQPGQAPAQSQPQDPRSFLAQLVQQELQPIRAQFEQQQSQQLNATVSEIQAFAADPAHPFFNDVANDIRLLIESNRIAPGPPLQRLQQAYDQATWMNPTIRPHLMAAQGEEAAKRKAAEVSAVRNAQRLTVTGPPLHGNTGSVMGGSDGSIRGDLLAAMRDQTGAV